MRDLCCPEFQERSYENLRSWQNAKKSYLNGAFQRQNQCVISHINTFCEYCSLLQEPKDKQDMKVSEIPWLSSQVMQSQLLWAPADFWLNPTCIQEQIWTWLIAVILLSKQRFAGLYQKFWHPFLECRFLVYHILPLILRFSAKSLSNVHFQLLIQLVWESLMDKVQKIWICGKSCILWFRIQDFDPLTYWKIWKLLLFQCSFQRFYIICIHIGMIWSCTAAGFGIC